MSGQGRVRILKRDEQSFDYEITAVQGKFRVAFTSHERWMHSSDKGDFEFRESIFEYMEYLRKDMEQRIRDDHTGTFDVIKFLKDKRNS